MTTFTNSKLTDEYVSNATLIRLILWADQHNSHYVVAALRELQERRKADSVPVEINDDMAYAFHHALSDSSPGADEVEEIKAGLRAAFANVTAQPASVVPEAEPVAWTDEEELRDVKQYGLGEIFQYPPDKYTDSRRVIPLYRVPPASAEAPNLPGGFTIEEAKELHENLVKSHISKALSGEKMKKENRDADLRWIRDVIVQAAWFVKASLEKNSLSGNSPGIPDSWISCSERMPEIRQTVIGWNGYAVRQCVYTRNEYAKTQKGREPRFETLTGIWHGVTHWMPLPEPPQGG